MVGMVVWESVYVLSEAVMGYMDCVKRKDVE
jgi:hypothetical protein